MSWLLIGYMWLFIHRPFEIWPWMGAYRIERVYMIVTLICWLVSGPSFPRWNRLHTYFLFFVLALLVSWLRSPYFTAGQVVVEDYFKYAVFYVLLIACVRDRQSLYLLLTGFVCVMTLLMAHSMREWFLGRAFFQQGIDRLGGVCETFGDQNDFAGLIVMSLPFGWVLWCDDRTRWKRLLLAVYFGLAIWCVMRTGSRMGLVGVMMAACLAVIALPKKQRIRAVILSPLVLAAAWFILPGDIQGRYLTMIDPSYGPVEATGSADNRSRYFWIAVRLFNEQPVFGYGPNSFIKVSGVGQAPHNVYGQLLSELGIVGACAFGLIVAGVIQNARDAKRIFERLGLGEEDRLALRTAGAALAAIVLTLGMGWSLHFLYWHAWLWFGAFQIVSINILEQSCANSDYELATC